MRNKLFSNRSIDDTELPNDSRMRSIHTTNTVALHETYEWRNEMTTTTLRPPHNVGIPRHGPTTKRRLADATDGPLPIVKLVFLDQGNLLRIRNGRGTQVRVASGVLWLTEENSPEDHVLLPGDAIDLAHSGTALALALQVSRVVIEVPVGVTPPRAVEIAMVEGEPGMRIALAEPTPIAARIAMAIENEFASIRRMVTTLRLRWGAADASTAKTYTPMTYDDGFPPKRQGQRMTHGPRECERGMINEWMLWRL